MMGKLIDLTGQKFGRLLIISKTSSKNGKVYWHCKCDCGNEKDVRGDSLKSGVIQSCGCLKKESDIQKCKNINNIKDLSNMTFGYLKPLFPTKERNNGHVVWNCECLNCKKQNVLVSSLYLLRGDSISCGCIKRSNGEQKIVELLSKANINFEEQKTFESCRFPDTNSLARFDFWVNEQYLIEYDGEQHYNKNNPWYQGDRDFYKNNWCLEHNIPLIRIPYTKLSTLSLEDLLLK